MAAGDVVRAPDGSSVSLVDIGHRVLLENAVVRVWEVALAPGQTQPWHLHHNPYVVLSLNATPGRMDWLDGAPPRFLQEYTGGAVYRPVSPVHRLSNIGAGMYRNRLLEFKTLGELRDEPLDIGTGARSAIDDVVGPDEPDGRCSVIVHPHTHVWTLTVAPHATVDLQLAPVPHVFARFDGAGPNGGVHFHPAGPTRLTNDSAVIATFFVVSLDHRAEADPIAPPGYDAESALNPTPPRPADVPEDEWRENLSNSARYGGLAADASREHLVRAPDGMVGHRFREILLQTDDLDWAEKTLAGLSHKPLWRDDDTGASISLVRFRAGAGMPSRHSHASNQFMFCLAGRYTYLPTSVTLTPGSFYWNPKGSLHGPTRAEQDSILIEVYDGPHYPTQPDWYSSTADSR